MTLSGAAMILQNDFSFVRNNGVTFYRLVFETNGIPKVKEAIHIAEDLTITLTYENIHVPLPDILRTTGGK